MRIQREQLRPEVALLGFAAAVFFFHHLPSIAGESAGDWIDLVTPFVVIAAAALTLVSLGGAPAALGLALFGAVLYVDGHGIHLAANSIGHETLTGDAKDVTHFWDETFGHIEWHLGLITLAAAVVLAEAFSGQGRQLRLPPYRLAAVTVLLFGFTLFSTTVEGGTWWLALGATVVFAVCAIRAPRALLTTLTGAFALASLLIAAWAIWHGGVPQFSDVGWL